MAEKGGGKREEGRGKRDEGRGKREEGSRNAQALKGLTRGVLGVPLDHYRLSCSRYYVGCPMGVQSYRDLKVWNTAVELALEVYRITESFPQSERFGLTSPLRRAAV